MSDSDRAARYSDLFGAGDGHEHEHGSDCSLCPICAGIAVLREANPEVVEHLAAAARELVAAAGILIEEAEKVVGRSESGGDGGATGGRVRRIDIG